MLPDRDFLSSIWPLGDYRVPGKQLQQMYQRLLDRDTKDGKSGEQSSTVKKPRRPDLEDGEIASDREERRNRNPYGDDRRDHRREERREERRDERREERREDRREERQESRRPNYYGNGDRLDFHRHRRDSDRIPVRSSAWQGQGRSPPARNSPY